MSHSSDTDPSDARARELSRQRQEQMSRFFVAFAVVEGLLLAVSVIAIYVLELIDPELGVWVLIGIGVLGGTVLSTYILSTNRRNRRELDKPDLS
ncbi:hypothetical protein [Brachybacterium tyrofermentans]|uniref:AtpZ/AtpI family protein n=1 Tax=Brachybacterium tyrofermentans TaxID=47848 RepID=A0ABW0FJE8_9MICO|nr:hypothetical protein FM103_06995 [Corynebacterium xerosis]